MLRAQKHEKRQAGAKQARWQPPCLIVVVVRVDERGRNNPRRILATARVLWYQRPALLDVCSAIKRAYAPGASNAPATTIVKPMTLFACLGQGSRPIRSQSARAECSTPVGLQVETVSSTRIWSGEFKSGPNNISSSGPPKLRAYPPQL